LRPCATPDLRSRPGGAGSGGTYLLTGTRTAGPPGSSLSERIKRAREDRAPGPIQ